MSVLKAPGINIQLEAAEAKLAEIEKAYAQAAFDAADAEKPSSPSAKVVTARKEARQKVADLRAAHGVAIKQDEATLRTAQSEQRKSEIAKCRSHMQLRNKAAARIEALLTDFAKEYRTMIEQSAKAKNAASDWGLERGRLVDRDELDKVMAHEMFRLTAEPVIGGKAVPGAHPPSEAFRFQPHLIPSLSTVLSKASDQVIAKLEKVST